MRRRSLAAAVLAAAGGAALASGVGAGRAPAQQASAATVVVDARHVIARFAPGEALGAALDGHDAGSMHEIYTRANVRAMRSAGFAPITYRLRTELAVEAWHWNPVGRWSDPARREGYWTSSDRVRGDYGTSYGYRLPRRGDTFDQANDDGYSRIDDGRVGTFWKSDPYLDPAYTHESDARHAQWVVVDLRRPQPVDGAEIDWAPHFPYARRLAVEYWVGADAMNDTNDPSEYWTPFPLSSFRGHAGRQRLRLAGAPIAARFIRIELRGGSRTRPPRSRDRRDGLGFAIAELRVGRLAPGGGLVDLVRHAASGRQSPVYVSSTDPWHRATDRDPNIEQPSFQRILGAGLGAGRPMLVPVALLYGTPADAAAELIYLRRLRVPLRGVELGEEPDGQYASPEDYGALYARFAATLRRVDRRVALGGPGYQTAIPDWTWWPDARGNRSWTNRFIAQLSALGARRAWRFFSFEWYPFDDTCADPASQLLQAPGMLVDLLRNERRDGVPPAMPKLITEYGYSSFAGRAEVDRPGALLNADIVGTFLAHGGRAAYLYGSEPDELISELRCGSWGNLTLFLSDSAHRIRQPAATYWGARLLTRDWTQPGDRAHALLATSSSSPSLAAYAVCRPDGRLALMAIDKDPSASTVMRVQVRAGRGEGPLSGAADVWKLGGVEYVWHAAGAHGYARPDRPPLRRRLRLRAGAIALGPYSLSVLRTARPARACGR